MRTMDAFWGQRKGGTLRHQVDRKEHSSAALVLEEINVYDVLSPWVILERALAEHKEALAEFVGRILGDGSPIIAPTYSASEIENQERMQSLVVDLFDYCPEIKTANGNYRIQLRRLCGRTLKLLDIPFGRKSVTNPSVPAFIMKSDEPAVWISFLRGLFDDEAYVSARGIEIGLAVRQVTTSSAAADRVECSRVLDDVSELLLRLGVQHVRRMGQHYKVRDATTICWFLRIPRREFRRVDDLRLFRLKKKRQKLRDAL
jgi:hypothetical protein